MASCRTIIFALVAPIALGAQSASYRPQPVIDMHAHAWPGVRRSGETQAAADSALVAGTLREMRQHHVVLALASGPADYVARYHAAAPTLIAGGIMLPCLANGRAPNGGPPCFASGSPWPDTAWLRGEVAAGRVGMLGEVSAEYAGMSPADERLEPYYALAEALEIPVGVHTGIGPPGTATGCCPEFRIAWGRPALLEPILIRHPRLRLWVMHAGYPYGEELIALMLTYPQVYADLAVLDRVLPRDEYQEYVRRLVRAGLGDRLMFGSDGPAPLGPSIAAVEQPGFLSAAQRRAILYDNAARFLRLSSTPTR